MDPYSLAIGFISASIIFSIITMFRWRTTLASSALGKPPQQPNQKTADELIIEQNRVYNSSLYRLQDLILDVNTKRDIGVIVDLNFYPRTNYLFYVSYIRGKKLLEIVRRGRVFHDSDTIFREHISAYGVDSNCFVELTDRQLEMLKITKSEQKKDKQKTEITTTTHHDEKTIPTNNNFIE